MPSILSKILMPEWNVPYNCYELGHTWTPFCTEAALEIGLIVFNQSLKLYAPLYLVNQVIQKKFDGKNFKESIDSIIRSSIFLGINAFLVILFFCLSRHVLGRFYYTLCAYMPSFFGSLLAILNERPSRQRALAFYVANIASENLYRILTSRRYIRPLPNGQWYLFATGITILLLLYENNLLQDPLIKFVFKLILGCRKPIDFNKENSYTHKLNVEDSLLNNINLIFILKNGLIKSWSKLKFHLPLLNLRHSSCIHLNSCIENALFTGFIKSFTLGWLSQLCLRSVSKLMSGHFRHSLNVFSYEQLFSSRNISFALFLSTFTTIYNCTKCLLVHYTNDQHLWHNVLAAILASTTIHLAPSTSLTLYLVWKSIEACFNVGIKKGIIPCDRLIVALLYAIATSQLFYAAILDPSHMKPSYKRFIDKVTQNKLNYINRNVLEVFGTNASKGYESFLPKYDLKHTTRQFQESVLVWLL